METKTKWLPWPRRVASSYGASRMEEAERKSVGKALCLLHFAGICDILQLSRIAVNSKPNGAHRTAQWER